MVFELIYSTLLQKMSAGNKLYGTNKMTPLKIRGPTNKQDHYISSENDTILICFCKRLWEKG
jgi:hypothetical protein